MAHIAKTTGKPDKRIKPRRHPEGCDAIGRPAKIIDWAKVDDLLIAGCTGAEVASYFDMHPNTFYDRVMDKHGICFTEYSTKKKKTGESILRAHQYAKALGITKEGDNTLLIWLGKQRLQQRETPEAAEATDAELKGLQALLDQLNRMQNSEK